MHNMALNSDDFKATALTALGHPRAGTLTAGDRDRLWRMAFTTNDRTAKATAELARIIAKIGGVT